MKKKLVTLLAVVTLTVPAVAVFANDDAETVWDANNKELFDSLDKVGDLEKFAADHGVESGLTDADKEKLSEKTEKELKDLEKKIGTVPEYTDTEGKVLNPETAGKLAREVVEETKPAAEKPAAEKPAAEKPAAEKPAAKPVAKAATKTAAKALPKTSAAN